MLLTLTLSFLTPLASNSSCTNPIDLSNRFELLIGREVLIIYGQKAAEKDVKAANLINKSLMNVTNLSVRVVSDSDVSPDDLIRNDLILIGGPLANKVTQKLQSELSVWLTKLNGKLTLFAAGLLLQNSNVGLVSLDENPLNNEKYVFTVMGMTRNGTLAAAMAFSDSKILMKQVSVILSVDGEYKEYGSFSALPDDLRSKFQELYQVYPVPIFIVGVASTFKVP